MLGRTWEFMELDQSTQSCPVAHTQTSVPTLHPDSSQARVWAPESCLLHSVKLGTL